MLKFKKVTHIIFDLDGTIIDTESIGKRIHNEIAKKYGKTFSEEVMLPKLLGRREDDIILTFMKETGIPLEHKESIAQIRLKMINEQSPTANLLPGVEKLFNHFKKNNIPMALATSNPHYLTEYKLSKFKNISNSFSHIVSGDDPEVINGKPAPDIFLVAASRFSDKPNPENCLVFEDAPNGVTGGICAGMQVVMVPDPKLPKEFTNEATLVLKSLCDFQPECFCLPKFND